jgi:mandelate racemase
MATLTLQSIRARPVLLKLERPIVARIATITDWPLILIDIYTAEGVTGRSYLEPYLPKAMRYLVPALEDLGARLKGRTIAHRPSCSRQPASRCTSWATRVCLPP